MWRPWSAPLEWLGRLGLRVGRGGGVVRVGYPSALDAAGGMGWREYLSAERLYDVWGPVPESPWTPFHCVPLFAALDRIPHRDVGPTPPVDARPGAARSAPPSLPPHARPGAAAPPWVARDTWTIVDLPGPRAVECGAWLVTEARCQPVCTFDNWPHPKGLLRPEDTLAELLRWATAVAEVRERLTAQSPPVWICDSDRLGDRPGRPGEFDNRYYLDDSILPGPALLARARIRRAVYVSFGNENVPLIDLEAYFADLLVAGMEVLHVDLNDPALAPRPFSAPRTPRPPPRAGFRRSAAGGFGTEVPQPSSSGG